VVISQLVKLLNNFARPQSQRWRYPKRERLRLMFQWELAWGSAEPFSRMQAPNQRIQNDDSNAVAGAMFILALKDMNAQYCTATKIAVSKYVGWRNQL
jgi:hypothetical protein